MKNILLTVFIACAIYGCNDAKKEAIQEEDAIVTDEVISESDNAEEENVFNVTPVSHATMVMQWDNEVIFVDPVGGKEAFQGYSAPDIILLTDIHEDHLNVETLQAVVTDSTQIIAPKAVAEKLPKDLKGTLTIMGNGNTENITGFTVEAIPMYNLRKEALDFHPKGRGNGYLLEKNDKRVYISGDTEDIPEMRALKNIDIAFVSMNLPYTMPVENAADAVLEFKPNIVYPYHYRGTEGLSDVDKFKSLVEAGEANIKVTQLDWYPKRSEK